MPITGYVSGCLGSVFVLAYTGPQGAVAGATAWWGLRAYGPADIGTAIIRLRRSNDNLEQDFNAIAPSGGVDIASIATFKGAANLFVAKLYDQVGTNHLVQGSAAAQPAFTLAGLGALPIITFDPANNTKLGNTAGAFGQPVSYSAVAIFTGSAGSNLYGSSNIQLKYHDTVANQFIIYAGAVLSNTCSDNAWHAIQGVFNSTSSNTQVDGTASLGDAGVLTGVDDVLGSLGSSTFFQGSLTEFGRWSIAFSAGQCSAMRSNQSAYYGTP